MESETVINKEFKEMDIPELVEYLITNRENLKNLDFSEKEPELKKAFTISEYKAYIKKKNAWNIKFNEFSREKTLIECNIKEIEIFLRKTFPNNVWIMNEEKTHAVGVRYMDWGGGTYDVFASRIINGNTDDLQTLRT